MCRSSSRNVKANPVFFPLTQPERVVGWGQVARASLQKGGNLMAAGFDLTQANVSLLPESPRAYVLGDTHRTGR